MNYIRYPKGAPDAETYEKLLVWEHFGFADAGFFVEVGAFHPKYLSQTWLLEKVGWKGILVEPLPAHCELLLRERSNSRVCQAAVGSPAGMREADFHVHSGHSTFAPNVREKGTSYEAVVKVNVTTLDALLEAEHPERVDFVSIDTEGTELDVLAGFDLGKYRPSLVLVEDSVYTLDLHRHFRRRGYKLIRRTGINNWYVPEERAVRVPLAERWRLFRKMRLGLPLRAWRFRRRKDGQ